MFTIREYAVPQTLEEAYEILTKSKNNVVLGGCMWLRMSRKKINVAVDLQKLALDEIKDLGTHITMGAMVSLGALEKSRVLKDAFGNCFYECVNPIVGTQFKNGATLGGSVFSRFGFSDVSTLLLGLNAKVKLFHGGLVSMKAFQTMKMEKDIIEYIVLPKNARQSYYKSFRLTATDLPVINCCAAVFDDNQIRIAVGARPHKAVLSLKAMAFLNDSGMTPKNIKIACNMAVDELGFGSNMRGSLEYRQDICKAVLEDCLTEVAK